MKSFSIVIVLLILMPLGLMGQANIIFDKKTNRFTIKNRMVERVVQVTDKNQIYSTSIKNLLSGSEYLLKPAQPRIDCQEFSFRINGEMISGRSKMWQMTSHNIEELENGSQRLRIDLQGKRPLDKVTVSLYYVIYPDVPVIRKWLTVANASKETYALTDFSWEDILVLPKTPYMTEIYSEYGMNVKRMPYVGGVEDPALLVYNPIHEEGFIVGNEAPGLLKRTDIYSLPNRLKVEMNRGDSDFPFLYYLKTGETFISPKSFLYFFKDAYWQNAFEGDFDVFKAKYLDVKLFERQRVPLFLYNTWNPFRKDINADLIKELVDASADTGIEYFIIDDGWQNNRGDWEIDTKKFPQGLKPISKYIRDRGMVPGLWIALTDIDRASSVFDQYQEWIVLDKKGEKENLHSDDQDEFTVCLGTPYYDYMLKKVKDLVGQNDIGYLKIDISAVKSAYVFDKERAGCYATHHKGHRDHDDSFFVIYSRIMQYFDELKKEFPDLYIDCTFELWGYYHLIDYALIQHADGDWLSNIEFDPPKGSMAIREMAYQRANVIPVSTMLIGNQILEADNHEFSYLSLLSATPIMLGDPRKLTKGDKMWYKAHHDWLRRLEDKFQWSHYFQQYPNVNLPAAENWDSFTRFNPKTGGGLLCFFRNGSADAQRIFRLSGLDPEKIYQIKTAVTNTLVGTYKGIQLMELGFPVGIDKNYSASVFAIEEMR